jgi:hypothetical protein
MSDRSGQRETNTRSAYQREGFPGQPERRPDSSPIYERQEYEEHPYENDETEVAMSAKLAEEAMGFPNLAGDSRVQEEARHLVNENMSSVYNVNEFLRNKWLILYRLYRGETIAAIEYGLTQLHSPEPYKAVETWHPRAMKALFGQEPWYRFEGEQDQDEVGARHQEALCRHQHREMGWLTTASQLVRSLGIYGTAIQKTYWEQKYRTVAYQQAQRVPDEEHPGLSKTIVRPVQREEFTFDGNAARQVSIFDFFTSPNVGRIEDAEWAADRTMWSQGAVLKMGRDGHWKNLDQLKDRTGDNDINFGDEFKERKAYSYGVFDSREAALASHINHFEVLDWWGLADFGDGEQIYNVVMLDPKGAQVVVLVRKNPLWHGQMPYQVARFTALEEELYGIGLIEPIARLSQEKDLKKNIYHQASRLESNPMLVVETNANVADGQLIARPGLVLRAESADAIKPLFIPKVSDAALQAMGELDQDIHGTTGITPAMRGQAQSDTATETMSDVNESNMRIMGPIENLERELITPMLTQMASNNQQFMTRPRAIRVLGPEGLKYKDRYVIRPENIVGRFMYIPMASYRLSTANVQNQQLINILDRAPALNMQEGRPVVKISALLGKILREGFGFRDVAEFLFLPPEQAGLRSVPEEIEMWYRGQVPPVKDDDDHERHFRDQMAAIETPQFAEFGERFPGTAAEARAHVMDHGRRVAMQRELQESAMQEATQRNLLLEAGKNGGQAGGRGFNGPMQDQESPNFRKDEPGMPEDEDANAKSEGSQTAPNPGGS